MWLKQNKWKVLVPVLMLLVLAAAFWFGGDAPGMQGLPGKETTASSAPAQEEAPAEAEPIQNEQPAEGVEPESIESRPGGSEGGMNGEDKIAAAAKLAEEAEKKDQKTPVNSIANTEQSSTQTGKHEDQTSSAVPEKNPLPMDAENTVVGETAYTCTLSVRCDTILNRLDWLDPEKTELVPADGVIFPEKTVTFYEGESVFHVLQRELKKAKIHMEFENTPVYNSAYIEGIGNLYELDCGELSGWMYAVNDWFPNYGCSRYALKAGDVVRWVYTTDLGVDVGGFSGVRQG